MDESRRSRRARDLDRLKTEIAALIRVINKPLHVVIAEHALPFLAPQSLHRLLSVSSSWNRHLSSPIFTHTQSHTPRSPSGLFLPLFLPFNPSAHSIPDPALSFLPPITCILSSSNGLICCSTTKATTYIVCNPSTRRWTPLPDPPPPAGVIDAVVLVFNPSVYNFRSDYFLVCAFELASVPGVYGFHVFSSASGTWRVSNDILSTERIVAGSGVSAGGVACWRTTMQTVAIYHPEADRARTVAWPAGNAQDVRWEMAAIAGKLCCVAVDSTRLSVYTLLPGDLWGQRADYLASVKGTTPTVWRWEGESAAVGKVWEGGMPRPLIFQSGNADVVVAVRQDVYVLDLVKREVKHVLKDATTKLYKENPVVFISTLAPLHPQTKVCLLHNIFISFH